MLVVGMLTMMFIGPNTVMNIDRSRSFYVLSWADNKGISVDKSGELILNVRSPEKMNVVSIKERVEEQYSRGLIKLQDDTYILTTKGRFMLTMANSIASFYDLEGWAKNKI
jgi:hypothetical protein